jgi:hypothetical protein
VIAVDTGRCSLDCRRTATVEGNCRQAHRIATLLTTCVRLFWTQNCCAPSSRASLYKEI